MDNTLLEPVKSYNAIYKQAFEKNAEELFNSLLKESKVNTAENKKTADAFRAKKAEYDNSAKQLSSKKCARGWLIALAVISFIGAIICFAVSSSAESPLALILVALLCVALGVFSILFICLKLNPIIKTLKSQTDKLKSECNAIYDKAMEQVHPLLMLFDDGMTAQLIEKTVPKLQVDPYYDMKRFDVLHGKYGLPPEDEEDTSVEGVISGDILDNPFAFVRKIHFYMGTKTYYGSTTISWTETETDSEGNERTVTHSETLTASVTKPYPYYNEHTYLVYGNDAAPNLTFSHKPSHAEDMSDKKRERVVKSKMNKIRDKAEKNMSFTEMDNEEFEALFHATDRNNEVEFRLLFTPLAQKNMVDLMKGELPTGDDFYFWKDHCINTISSEHIQKWDFFMNPFRYTSYDVELIKKNFIEYTSNDFQMIFYEFAPLLSIPLYQQIKPREYIYNTTYPRNFPIWQTETVANRFANDVICHPETVTPSIRKTQFLGKNGNKDRVKVIAKSFKSIPRTDHESVHGGDGDWHDVAIDWDEYIPLEKTTEMEIEDTNETRNEYYKDMKYSVDNKNSLSALYYHRIFANLKPFQFKK